MLGAARTVLVNGLSRLGTPVPLSALAVVLPGVWSTTAGPNCTSGIAQLRCRNQQAPVTLHTTSSTRFANITSRGTEETHVLRAVHCLWTFKPAAAPCRTAALQLQRPPVLQSPQGSAPSPLGAQAPVPTQSAPPSPQHICSAPLLTAAAAAWIGQLRAPFDPSIQLQPLLLSSPTTSALPAARLLRSRTCMPLHPLRAPPPHVRSLTAAPRTPRVPTTPEAPASPPQDHSARARSSSSSSSRMKKAARLPRSSSRCDELQQALEAELGSQHRLKPSQLTAGLERDLAAFHGIDLKARVAELRKAVGLEGAAAMVHSYPFLLAHVAPSDIPGRLDALGGAFDAGPNSIMAMVSGAPCAAGVLQHTAVTIQAKVATLCTVLLVDQKELLDICTKNMRVLTADHRGMALRLATLGDVLGLTPAQVADMCKRCNPCITTDPSNAAEVCRVVAAALEVEQSEAAQLCFNNPSLLSAHPAKVAEVARWLKQHLRLTCGDLGTYLFLLNANPSELTPRLEALPAALGITPEEALALVKAAPRLLLLPTAAMAASWRELRRVAGMRAEWKEQLGGLTASSLTFCLQPAEKITKRVAALLALHPASEHLPALSHMMHHNDADFRSLLQRMQRGQYRSKRHAARLPEQSIRARHPAMWRQL